uniref:Putative conserved secreted protein n=2 Tax=Nyssomyia neivai TaxID=330878 RepID=A0A1L8DNW0_9DIPT
MEKKILNILILVIFGISFTQGQRICYSCDSAVDPNCATLSTIPIPVTKTCASLTDSCVSAIIGTRTVRGCLAEDITGPCEGALCETCGANNCNGAIFPLDRAQCHRCEGAQCATITNNNNLEVCLNYVEGDSCYSVVTDEDTLVTYRGCHSDPATDLGRQECTRLDAQGYCVSCTGAACNSNAAKVPSQLQCTRCSGDTACRYGQPTDFGLQCNYDVVLGRQEYCYSYVTANNQVTRGCLYDPITNANHLAECEAGEPTCQLCTSSLCNHESYAYHTCYACDGHTDPNCGTLENAWYEPEVCPSGTLDQVGCFVATTDGVPMRGCVSLLNPDEISYCQSTASGCTICTTDNCNGRAPKTCITCDSSTDANCATVANPTALLQYSQQCPSSSAICISRISNGYTQRACSGTGISCTSGNPCWQCDGANCNTDVLPLDRLKCYKCSGAGCADVTTETNLEVCEMYNTNDQCFTVVTDTEVTHRGCYSDPSSAAAKTVCTEHESGSDRCVKCTGEGCNTQVSKTPATLSCIKCTGAACGNSQASTPGQACFGDVLLGRTESCYSYIHDNGNVERGCLYDPNTPAAISNECTNSPGGRCKVCTAGSCNTEEIQVTETCYTCDSGLDPNCESMTGTIQTKQCPIGTVLGCFRSQVDGVVVRGCAGDLKSGEITLCQRGAQCKLCDGNNCNAKVDFQRCYTCNSASSGAACLNLQDGSINQAVCSDYMDTCLTAIGTNGETIRGCRSSFQQTFPTCSSFTCQTCADNYCNQAVFPTSRRLCHQCSGSGACADSLTSTGDSLSICPVYSATDECYSIVSNQAVYRGCTSSNTEGNTLCNAAGNNCVKCSTANGCNSAAAKSAPTLSCVKCAATDVACLWGFSNSVATRCTSDVWLGSQETCFRIPSGSSAIRGCTLDNPTQCPDGSSTCTKCTGNGCNTATYKRQQCLLCSSTTNGQDNCGSEPDEYTAADCSGDDQTYADRGCYVHVDDDGVVRRGCAKDIDNQLLSQCKDADDESCRYCEADGCNDWPAGASAIQAFSAAAVLLIAVAGKFFH